MSRNNLPLKNIFAKTQIKGWTLGNEIGFGNISVVYLATKYITNKFTDQRAVKIIPVKNLRDGWDSEIEKAGSLRNIPQVVQYYDHSVETLKDGKKYVCIFWEYVNGPNLRQYLQAGNVSLAIIQDLVEQVLHFFYSMHKVGSTHGDLHAGNIMIAKPDPLQYGSREKIKITDFGIGGSRNKIKPKDDYTEFANFCHLSLEKLDPAELNDTECKRKYDYLIEDFLTKKILERNTSVGDFVRNPEKLLEILKEDLSNLEKESWKKPVLPLKNPFDYLSCEQIGDSFELLQALYSKNYPGYDELLQKSNTILTGPRGCGKTTIFKNLSLKTQLLAGKIKDLKEIDNYIGIYFHCGNLFFAFHSIYKVDKQILIYYFSLALLKELLVTLLAARSCSVHNLDEESILKIERYLKANFNDYRLSPQGTDILRNITSFIDQEQYRICNSMRYKNKYVAPKEKISIKFIPNFCAELQKIVKWMNGRPIYFFLDDYSLPHVSPEIQKILHDIILYRWSACYFKIATESITTIHPYDSTGKLLEETREYDVIDLGAYFIRNPHKKEETSEDRQKFLLEVINNRLENTDSIHSDYKDISKILGSNPYGSYNKLALQIRGEESGTRVFYSGFDIITDLFSGDIADILRLVRNILSGSLKSFAQPGFVLPIAPEVQDRAMREYGANFLGRVEAAPKTGPQMRHVAEAFGRTANWVLKNQNSKNEAQNPSKQAFRIEVRDRFSFDNREQVLKIYNQLVFPEERKKYTFEEFLDYTKSIYYDLLRYGVFLRDVRGKSQRGAISARLYLRRLLIPAFVITPNQRDNIGLEVEQFFDLLYKPDRFYKTYISGRHSKKTDHSKELDLFE